ncbi:hypothetical protein [Cellvibrio sp.]|uniref:hypothetical protein n=1 Tax=Cellvibrio sp. TaxID=1965322 RepID=UPI0039648A0C
MSRNYLAFGASAVILSFIVYIYFDFFSFSKTIFLPSWMLLFPFPMLVPSVIIGAALIPATFIPHSVRSVVWVLVASLSISPLAGLIHFALSPIHQHGGLIYNILFNYFWIILYHCFVPMLILFAIRFGYELVRSHR